jgi:hypothetical protein
MNAAWAVTELRASVSQNQMTLADTVEYRVEITGDAAAAGTQPQPPDFRSAGFEAIGGPSTEQRISIINNMQAAPSLTVRWLLRPMREGELQIGPTRVPVVGGQTMESSPVQVTVSKMPAAAPGGGAAPIKPGEEIYSARTGNEAIDRQLRDRLFLRPVIDKTDAYVGEQITLTYELCQAEGLNISGYGYEQLPSYPGFMVQTLYEPPRGQLQFRRQTIAGVVFQIAPIQTVALFANKNGATTIPAVVLTAEIPVSRGARRRMPSVFDGFFDDPFFQDTVRARLVARPIAIRVLPLPTEGRPADFSGTVGDYKMTAAFDRPEVRQYDLVTLKVQFAGKGQMDAISPPRLPTVTGFERFKEQSGAAGGAKTFEFLLRPTEAGDVRFPAIEYAVFDPAHKQYERLQTPVLTLRVLPAPKPEKPVVQVFTPPTPGPGGETPSSVVELNRDIEYIRTTDFLRHGLMAVPLYEQPAFLAFQLAPIALLAASFAIRRRREKREGDVAWARRRSARSVASKRLRGARKLLSAPDGSRFFDELSRALRQFVADHVNESAAGLTGERIAHLLGERGVESAAVEEMVQVLDLCEAARYASGRPDLAEMRRAFERASELIDRLARELR